MNDSVGRDNAIRLRIGADDFELDSSHATANDERVVLVNGTICLQEVRLQVDFEEISRKFQEIVRIFFFFLFSD